jgi:hypothetical protein
MQSWINVTRDASKEKQKKRRLRKSLNDVRRIPDPGGSATPPRSAKLEMM